jgi:hypothetical protein
MVATRIETTHIETQPAMSECRETLPCPSPIIWWV